MKVLRMLLLAAVVGGPLLALASGFGLFSRRAEDLGTPAVAKALAERAQAMIREDGLEKALAAIAAPAQESELIEGSLYVFAVGLDGTILAHPYDRRSVGRSILGARDFNGVAYGRELVMTARTDRLGWVDYVDVDPVSRKQRRKSTYVLREGDLFVACGYYLK
jgi:signal transduction histidine kinase